MRNVGKRRDAVVAEREEADVEATCGEAEQAKTADADRVRTTRGKAACDVPGRPARASAEQSETDAAGTLKRAEQAAERERETSFG
ncbi:hypothetical protein [Nonomuraea helvata]|uniref:CsbD family protein n=1 Tax=Nonomuraea helvata TaxID=37484 RepID=A0ABV5S761_9ACTN